MFRRVLFPGFLLATFTSVIAAPPAWWASRGATDANPPNDDAAVNQGQLKQFTQKAVQELNARIPGGADSELNDLVNGWIQAYQTGGYSAANLPPADFDAMNSGQLKWIANKVHARLVFAKYETALPAWLVPNPATDKQLVNLGQLKTVFNFDLTAPFGQLPEWWQRFYFNGQTGINPNSDPDTDGLTNLQEYDLNSNPNDINNRPKGMVAANGLHSVALTADGRVWSWGYNNSGELGDGTTANRNTPVPLKLAAGMAKVAYIGVGSSFSLALDENGALWAWGSNNNHKISKDATYRYETPVRIELPAPVARFACGGEHVVAADRTGRLWSWGYNGYGQLGVGHKNTVSGAVEITKPSGMEVVVSVAASGNASYALDATGKMWSWGSNYFGQLGDGSNTDRTAPVAIDTSTGVPAIQSIVAGELHAMAAAVDGSIWTWGNNGHGQLGRGSNTSSSNRPLRITIGEEVANTLGAGSNHSLVASQSGSVWGWGRNNSGQLGNNLTSQSNSPAQTAPVSGWSDMVQVAGGEHHSLALKNDGSIWSWGGNSHGQLGLGDNAPRVVPTQITNLKLADDDSDSDLLPDSWERFYFNGSLLQAGADIAIANGVTNLVAYANGLNPTMADNDTDGIPDGWEFQHGLNPLDDQDALEDPDGDRIPNVYEFANGQTIPNVSAANPAMATASASFPLPHITVDRAIGNETSALKKTIHGAINDSMNTNRYTIIRVKLDTYAESLTINGKSILLLGDLGINLPVIAPVSGDAVAIYEKSAALDGFIIRRGTTNSPYRGLTIDTDLDRDQVRIVNCTISGFSASYGSAAYLYQGKLTVAHCTIMDNSAKIIGRAFYVQSAARLILQNSIVWNPSGTATQQIYHTPGTATALTSIILGGELGCISTDPMTDRNYCLMSGSPALGAGTALPVSALDRHGDPRLPGAPDIGADQRLDSDSDSLPDYWEKAYFGNLTKASTDDNDTPTFDRLTNDVEYLLGFDPTKADSLLNGSGDLFNAVFGSIYDSWYPPDWRLDPDDDGLTNGRELYYGTDPLNPDTNDDGTSDGAAVQAGISTTSSDTDGDGISNGQEILNGTNPILGDTDGDLVADNLDPFPTDPRRWIVPTTASGDETPPQIILITPENATPL